MLRVNITTKECTCICDGCGVNIKENSKVCEIELGVEPLSNMAENILCLCRICENTLRKDLNTMKLARELSK